MKPATISPLQELRNYSADFVVRCRQSRWFGAMFHARVICDIVADETKTHEQISREAYSAEQLDREALKAIDAGDIALARRLVAKSADQDREISELASI